MILSRIFLLFFCMAFANASFALNVETPIEDAALEARAQNLFHEIRCVVCQGETIADSPAEVAGDLRRLVRKRVANGEPDDAIKAYLVSRYGEVILMSPPLKTGTFLLWFGPNLLVILAIFITFSYFRSQKRPKNT